MSLRLVTADMRLSAAMAKTTMTILGPSGAGKTRLAVTLPGPDTLCLDFEAGLMSVQDWDGDSIPIRSFEDARDLACLIGGVNPAADPKGTMPMSRRAIRPSQSLWPPSATSSSTRSPI